MSSDYDRLTREEKKLILLMPGWKVISIYQSSKKALKEAQKRYGGGSLHNGSGDAFRHCYWNALMARNVGKKDALRFSTAHEKRPGNPDDEKEMDLHNNKIGAEIGALYPNSSDAELADMCAAKLQDKKLKTLKND